MFQHLENKIISWTSIFYLIHIIPTVISQDKDKEMKGDDERLSSVVIIIGFLAIILLLFGIGFGCSYLCFRKSASAMKKRNLIIQQESLRLVGGLGGRVPTGGSPQVRPNRGRKHKRGVPNWYAPGPDDDKDHLLLSNNTAFTSVNVQTPTRNLNPH